MGKTSSEVKNRYNAKVYDRINLIVPKGRRDEIKAYAEAHGESMNAFIVRLIDDYFAHEIAHGNSES